MCKGLKVVPGTQKAFYLLLLYSSIYHYQYSQFPISVKGTITLLVTESKIRASLCLPHYILSPISIISLLNFFFSYFSYSSYHHHYFRSGQWCAGVRADCTHFPIQHSVTSPLQLEVGYGGSIYATRINKLDKSGVFCFWRASC